MGEILSVVGLGFIGRWPWIRAHTSMMTTLMERWDSWTCKFHLSTREATITLLDVWRILKIPVRGMIPKYQIDGGDYYLHQVCEHDALPLEGTWMHLGRSM